MTKKGLENDTSQERVDETAKQRHDLNRPIETDYVSQVAYTRALERFCDALLAQRTWVGLTDKEIEAIWKIAMFADYGIGAELSNQPFVHYARAIEAKLKEKNQ